MRDRETVLSPLSGKGHKHLHMWLCLLPRVAALVVNPDGHAVKDESESLPMKVSQYFQNWLSLQADFFVILES